MPFIPGYAAAVISNSAYKHPLNYGARRASVAPTSQLPPPPPGPLARPQQTRGTTRGQLPISNCELLGRAHAALAHAARLPRCTRRHQLARCRPARTRLPVVRQAAIGRSAITLRGRPPVAASRCAISLERSRQLPAKRSRKRSAPASARCPGRTTNTLIQWLRLSTDGERRWPGELDVPKRR